MTAPRQSTIVCDVGTLAPDAVIVDALTHLELAARRLGLKLRHASSELQELLAFCGLREVLLVEAVGQAEQREQRLGVEEERELDDPAG